MRRACQSLLPSLQRLGLLLRAARPNQTRRLRRRAFDAEPRGRSKNANEARQEERLFPNARRLHKGGRSWSCATSLSSALSPSVAFLRLRLYMYHCANCASKGRRALVEGYRLRTSSRGSGSHGPWCPGTLAARPARRASSTGAGIWAQLWSRRSLAGNSASDYSCRRTR